MAQFPERNAPRTERGSEKRPAKRGRPNSRRESSDDDWIWGWHAVVAALANPQRGPPSRLLASAERARQLEAQFGALPALTVATPQDIARHLPQASVHQGVALKAAALEPVDIDDFDARPGARLLMLDQVTDPQNVGAILRSAAAFGASGVILQDRNAPRFTGALAKAAAGALDKVAVARVVNLSRTLERLADNGWRAVGLSGAGHQPLDQALDGSPTVLVLGSEGEGLRRLVTEHCDALATIPMPGGFESLNVAAAAAIALYESARLRD